MKQTAESWHIGGSQETWLMLGTGPYAHDKIANEEPISLSAKYPHYTQRSRATKPKTAFFILDPLFLLCEKDENSIHLVALFLELASRDTVSISQVPRREQNR